MICILSEAGLESTTDQVMAWLRSWGMKCVRINGEDLESEQKLVLSLNRKGMVAAIDIDGVTINPREVKVVWHRRWASRLRCRNFRVFHQRAGRIRNNNLSALFHVGNEIQTLGHFFFTVFDSAIWLGNPRAASVNKLSTLWEAARCGLDIPDTVVTNKKSVFQSLHDDHKELITKAISDAPMWTFEHKGFASYTHLLRREDLDKYPDFVFPSLAQEALDKEYEIRTFALDGDFYSMAIFSQSSDATKTDFRIYQYEHPTRTVPYRLPEEIETKLRILMAKLQLDTGSIDLIKTRDGRYVFLEVNPVGQFGMTSGPCNYQLEQKVAQALCTRYERAMNTVRTA